MKRITLISLLAFLVISVSAQKNSPDVAEKTRNGIFVSILGDGSNVSLNYERLVRINDFIFLTGSLGAGYGKQLTLTDTISKPVYLTIPARITLNAGKGRHFAEAGFGSTAAIGDVYPHLLYYFTGGYRFQPLNPGNLSIRIYGNWLFNGNAGIRNVYFVPFGISLGIAF